MKSIQRLFLLLIAASLGYSAALRAEDTDIYVDGTTSSGTPNVLFVIDTGANFSSSASTSCTYTIGGGSPSMGQTAGGIEQCALVNAIEGLTDGVVNIGIMVNNNNNFANETRVATDAAYHETCGGTYGGCLVRKLKLMDATNKANLVTFIKSWKTSGSNSATEFNVKSGGDRTANSMQESWAYYNGKIGMSTKNYSSSILSSGCQKNFIIYIGNAFNNSGGPADGGSESPYNGTYGLTATQTAATSAQLAKISETVKFSPSTCGVTSSVASTNASNWSENWADEWARLMYEQDGGASGNTNTQNIITYTIGVVDDSGCKADYPALLSTMAKYGGGKYYKTSTSTDIKTALDAILNEVQAVNSVFSSASLPVSVNAEGSYLNQIYLGMFRPDPGGAPRWMGNLKQYQLIKNNSGNTVLGDANGNAAISAAGTGFITPTAVSFWTYKNTAAVPDDATTGGFWVNNKQGVPPSGYDSPDGEVVEKGGVAQQIRKENLTGTFIGATGASGNARRMYTYCPAGTSCVASLTDVANAFTTANAGISSSAFGSTTTVKVNSIVRTGTTALVTTSGNHGFSSGTTVTISNAGQNDYNVSQSVTVNSSTTFTITGLPDYPSSSNLGTYVISPTSATSFAITSVSRTTSTTGTKTSEVVTVTTSAAHGFTTTSTVSLSGISPSSYNVSVTPSAVSTNSFTFSMTMSPNATSVNAYTAVLSNTSYPAITSTTLTNPADATISGTTPTAHKFHVGQTITVSGASDGSGSKYPGTYTVLTIPTSTTFTASTSGTQPKNQAGITATVAADTSSTQAIAVGKITRIATTDATVATVTGLTTDWFGHVAGDTKVVNLVKSSGTNTNESAYAASGVTITCLTAGCTSFTFPIAVTPASSGITFAGATAAVGGSSTMYVNTSGQITRSGTTATVTGATASNFTTGQSVNISASGTALAEEAAYVGTWTITCSGLCTTFTFGPVTLSPATPATGTNIQAYSSTTAPNKDTIVKWLRGEDNYGDEKGPAGASGVTVRPSVHGDVLHSRPLVINYGDTRGIVVFYGSNDGLYRAINGNQTTAIGSVPAGGELWSFILPDHYANINRLRLNSPEIKFPSTTLASAQTKDYFVDGPTGSYQKLNADGTINTSYIYMTMRRGGRYMYGVNVTTPTAPSVLWKISNTTTGFSELGQTWSRPKTTLVQGGGLGTTPVLVFGAGYDVAEDSQPPGTDSMGRGIFVVNAATGALIWSANPTCTTSATCRNVGTMTYAVPSDITTVDRDGNGYADKLYWGDTGGNIWRADITDADTANWTVTRVAALGCDTGACSSGTTPRKFFFPSVLTVKGSGVSGSYDLISLASGDREHPLKLTVTGSSYYVNDRFFMIKDTGTSLGSPLTNNVVKATLFNATSAAYDGSGDGFYINFATAEKGVNAPLAVNGKIFFATNRPIDPSGTCAANLGEAKAYAVSPFLGTFDTKVLAGGGLPPSAVSGIVTITTTNDDNTTSSTDEKFCIGCSVGCAGSTCNVALENTPPSVSIPKNLRRTYWYKK